MSEGKGWNDLRPKAKVVGNFAKHCSDQVKKREKLEHFGTDMKDEGKIVKEILKSENKNYTSKKFRIRTPSEPDTKIAVRYTDKKLQAPFERETDIICHMCQKGMHPFKDSWYPCRVCNKVFHKECVLKSGAVHNAEKLTIDRAETNIGWSCHICADLSSLLTDEEMKSLIEDFDSCDINKDSNISLDEFLQYKQALSTEPMTDDDKDRYVFEFRMTDLDKDNTLDWWEFLNNESKRILIKRDKNQLVQLLTEQEIIEAKAVFTRLDENGDGQITETEAVQGYKAWFKRFERRESRAIPGIARDSTELDLHASSAAQLLMDADDKDKGSITWEDFLSGQACYILCSRPNKTSLYVNSN